MRYHFVPFSRNVKTGPIPVTYSERDTCPPSCPHYRSDCYAEDFYTRMSWDKVPVRGGDLDTLCRSIAARLPLSVMASCGASISQVICLVWVNRWTWTR